MCIYTHICDMYVYVYMYMYKYVCVYARDAPNSSASSLAPAGYVCRRPVPSNPAPKGSGLLEAHAAAGVRPTTVHKSNPSGQGPLAVPWVRLAQLGTCLRVVSSQRLRWALGGPGRGPWGRRIGG